MLYPHLKLNRTATIGAIAIGIAISFSSFSVVRAAHYSPDKKAPAFNCSSGTACLTVNSTGAYTYGMYATSTADDAVHAVTSSPYGAAALAGISTATTGTARGVYGSSNTGAGVYGGSTANTNSFTTASAVYGLSSTNGNSVYASGVTGEVGSSVSFGQAIAAIVDNATADMFYAENSTSYAGCVIDADADLSCSGSVSGGSMKVRQPTSSGRRVLAYAPESASATIEDVGTARMFDGVANVHISSDFAAVTDGNWYYVFLTPLGDTRGLYVSAKTAAGFQVRETERGRDSLEFDYRIVAHPLGAANDRLPPAPRLRRLAFTRPHQ
jgi:hypothetical protein